jgi:hypothetical protein
VTKLPQKSRLQLALEFAEEAGRTRDGAELSNAIFMRSTAIQVRVGATIELVKVWAGDLDQGDAVGPN